MAHKVFDKCYLDADGVVSRNCIWCGNECETTEVLDTGEAIELWCYCDKCNSECWHPITKSQVEVK